jgi:PAS domain S-box-containing protein
MRRDGRGKPVEVIAIVEDITERKRAEVRYRFLAESIPQMVWTATPDGMLDYVNGQGTGYFGVPQEALLGSGWLDWVHPAEKDAVVERWKQSLATGRPYETSFRLKRGSDGSWRWHLVRALPLSGDKANIVQWFGTCTDIEEQKRVEDELRRANQDLEQFAYSASHDLQEPLRSIKIFGELLAKRYGNKLDGQAYEFLDYLRTGATRMEILVRDLLAYTQVARIEAPAEDTDANEAFTTTLANLSGAIVESGARVMSDPLPSVPVHSTHLRQLFQNLIGNAIKYRDPERAPVVLVSSERRIGAWVFSVRDNGIGIEPEYKEHIFGLFKRLHTGDQYAGTGMGLAICQRIVERYNGRIWVESEPGQGSTFNFAISV